MAGPNADQTEPVKTIAIPYIHPKLDIKDLQEYGNGKLLSNAQIAAIKNEKILGKFNGRITKKWLNQIFKNEIKKGLLTKFKFSLEKAGDDYFAIYKGKKSALGAGGFGSVKILQNLTTGETSEALKVLKSTRTTEKDVREERRGLTKAGQFKSAYKRPDKFHQYEFVMEMAKGCSLENLIGKKLPAVVWMDIMIDVLKAVKALHDNGVIHRDIKPQNIIYDLVSRKATVIDLGIAIYTPNSIAAARANTHGTPGYMSAEALTGNYSEKTELFSLGVTFAQLLDLAEVKRQHFEIYKEDRNVWTIKKYNNKLYDNVIDDDRTRQTIFKMLQEMTSPEGKLSLNTIPGHVDIIEYCNKIRDEYLDTLGLTNRIAYLNVSDLQVSPKEMTKMLQGLTNIDQIWLVDNNGVNQSKYVEVSHRLAKMGFNVSDTVVQQNGNDLDQVMKNYADQREWGDRAIYDCSYVTKTGKLVSLAATLNEEQINKVIASLREEAIKLFEKQGQKAQQRIGMIKETMVTLQKAQKNPVTQVKVLSELDKLQKSMLSDKQSQKNIMSLMQSIENLTRDAPAPVVGKGFAAVKKQIDHRQKTPQRISVQPIPIKQQIPAKMVAPPLPIKSKTEPPPLPERFATDKTKPAKAKSTRPLISAKLITDTKAKLVHRSMPEGKATVTKSNTSPPVLVRDSKVLKRVGLYAGKENKEQTPNGKAPVMKKTR
ncbi:MAG: protein kinase [Pseudomonadota bacterium]